jgi:hypothetical protein
VAEQSKLPCIHPTADAAFAQLGRIPLAEASLKLVLQKVADLAQDVMPGGPSVSVTLIVRDKPETAVFTDPLALDLDEGQYDRGYGPCLEAAAGGQLVEITDARTEDRWPDYAAEIVDRGIRSSLSVPLPVQEQIRAALNIYSPDVRAFDDADRQLAARFASYAGVAVSNVRTFEDMRSRAEGLQVAMASRSVIDQAKGVLMERFKVTPDQAFRMLAAASMATNVKLREVADQLVTTGELPTLPASSGRPARRPCSSPRPAREPRDRRGSDRRTG